MARTADPRGGAGSRYPQGNPGKVMRRHPSGLYAVALAILAVGLVALGVPASALLLGAFVLACPLMMMLMMGGMHSRNIAANARVKYHQSTPGDHDQPTGGRR